MPNHSEAVRRLRADDFLATAEALSSWRNEKDGDLKGWDGWFRGQFPDLIGFVWPEEVTESERQYVRSSYATKR